VKTHFQQGEPNGEGSDGRGNGKGIDGGSPRASVWATDLNEPAVYCHQYGATTGSYPDCDNFNRVTTSHWTRVTSGTQPTVDPYNSVA
jgi:hypothetical protein